VNVPACGICGTTESPLSIWKDAIIHDNSEIEIVDSVRLFFCAKCNHEGRVQLPKPASFETDDLMPHERQRTNAQSE